MPTTKEQQQQWLRENWGELDADEDDLCVVCETTERPLFLVGGEVICCADHGVEAMEDIHPNLDAWASEAIDHGIYEDLARMVIGDWPPRDKLDELRVFCNRNIGRPDGIAFNDGRSWAFVEIIAAIDRLAAGGSVEEAAVEPETAQ